MTCGCGNCCFDQTLKFETCEYVERASSTNSLHHIFQIKHEGDNNVDGEMHNNFKKCVDKKHDACAVMSLEEVESSDANNDDAEIANEVSTTITN